MKKRMFDAMTICAPHSRFSSADFHKIVVYSLLFATIDTAEIRYSVGGAGRLKAKSGELVITQLRVMINRGSPPGRPFIMLSEIKQS